MLNKRCTMMSLYEMLKLNAFLFKNTLIVYSIKQITQRIYRTSNSFLLLLFFTMA